MTKRAAIYLRISLDRTGDEAAVERQLEDCLAIIAQRGWTQAGEPYVDNSVSASKRDVRRPSYDRMVEDYQRGAFDAIVCYDLDRLTRQPRQLEDWIDAAEETGLVIVTANGEADLSTDGGRMFARVKAAVARSEIERKGARHRRANERRAAAGRPHAGRRRYGYELDGETPREDEAAIVRRCFEQIANGSSLRSVAAGLLADNIPPGTGKGWGGARVRYMLLNPSYGGLVPVDGTAVPSDRITPIVSPELAEEVRAILTDEKRRTLAGPGRRHLSSGLASCGVEGCPNVLNVHSGYYTCQIRTLTRSGGRFLDDRPHASIKAELLDEHLRREMALALLTTDPSALAGDEPESAGPLVANLERIERATAATMADRDDELISPQAARSRLVALRDERREVEAALDAARGSRTSSASLATLARDLLIETAKRTPGSDFWELRDVVAQRISELDLDRQRAALSQLLGVTVSPGRGLSRVYVWHLVAEHLNAGADAAG
ncbi:recombinase family protein [Microbacterium sp. p3-SID336]|nr:recombinase family protein [Microbacterium sp. p3-SID336]MCT1476517.1 recombinase family protein [Microbacterium sp. p3-SID336]